MAGFAESGFDAAAPLWASSARGAMISSERIETRIKEGIEIRVVGTVLS
jgi:hypothetical protein